MAGETLATADVGWRGFAGDRRLDRGGFPWLMASRLPEVLAHSPKQLGAGARGDLPTHVRTPEGRQLPAFGAELAETIARRGGSPVEMMYLDRGTFDEASILLIASATSVALAGHCSQPPDARRYRPNILIALREDRRFSEDEWVGGMLSPGGPPEAVVIAITNRDERCARVNYDPDSARPAPEILKAIARTRDNQAGVYGTVLRRGRIASRQPMFFAPPAGASGGRSMLPAGSGVGAE